MSGEGPRTITGRSAFLELLEDEGVTHLFGNPGTTELPIMDALVGLSFSCFFSSSASWWARIIGSAAS